MGFRLLMGQVTVGGVRIQIAALTSPVSNQRQRIGVPWICARVCICPIWNSQLNTPLAFHRHVFLPHTLLSYRL